jgi:hypothetical protein
MPFNVKAEELKKVARLVGGLKDAGPDAQKEYYWNGVHRVVAEEDRFRLLTTNGDFFLDWDIPIVFGTGFAPDFTPVPVASGAARARGWRGVRRNR